MKLLAEGTVQELPCEHASTKGRGYRLIRKERIRNQPIAIYYGYPCELGIELICGRPSRAHGCAEAKANGFHTIVAGYVGWHPLYGFADEYWGILNWNSSKPEESRKVNRARDVALICSTMNISGSELHEGAYSPPSMAFDYSRYGLPEPSPKALEIAKTLSAKKKFFTLGAKTRLNGHEARDYHSWEMLHGKLSKYGFDFYVTCPKHEATKLPCEYVEDMVGFENHMDLELAMHSQAVASFTSNTGTAGLMLYAGSPLVFVFGGTGGMSPGWHGVRDSLAKIPGYKTKLFAPEPLYGPDEVSAAHALNSLAKELGG